MSYVNTWEPSPGDSFAHEIYQRMSQTPGAIGVARAVHGHMENNEPYMLWWIDESLSYNSTLRRGGYRTPFDIDEFDRTARQMLEETGRCQLLLNTTYTKAETRKRGGLKV